MGLRGPAPKPTAIKKVQGTYRPDRVASNEPTPAAKIPSAPHWLTHPEALNEWERITKELEPLRMISELDRTALAMYCAALGEYLDACERIEQSEDGMVIVSSTGTLLQHPAISVRNEAWRRVVLAAKEFGMTPSARTRVSVPEEKQTDENPFMALKAV